MSFFRKILKVGGNLLKSSGNPVLSTIGGTVSKTAGNMSKGGLRALPGVGQVLLPMAAGYAGTRVADRMMSDGSPMPRRRRRAKGITGSQLKGFRRVTKVLETYNHLIKQTKGTKTCR